MINYEENGSQILKIETIQTDVQIAIVKTFHCMLYNFRLINETDTHKYFQSTKFDIQQGIYVDDFTDEMQIEIDGQMYTPINGLIIIPK